MKNKTLWKKVVVFGMAAMLAVGIAGCADSTDDKKESAQQEEQQKEDENAEEEAKDAEKQSDVVAYQFVGSYDELRDRGMAFAMKMDLYEDGRAELDRYNYAAQGTDGTENSEQAEVYKTDEPYDTAYMTGTWEESEKDGVECLEIVVHATDADGKEVNEVTCYAYEVGGEYSFDLTFPLIVGQKYTRVIPLSGNETVQYADADALIAAYKEN